MTRLQRLLSPRARRLLRNRDAGSYALEMAISAPIVLVLIAVLIATGRVSRANTSVDQAAYSAARAASIARTPGQASTDARAAAASVLGQQGTTCGGGLAVTVNTAGFNQPPGTPAQVSAAVSCTVPLGDLAVPGLNGSRTLRATAVSALDSYRARDGS